MDLSGILMACRPAHLDEVRARVDALEWAEVFFTEPSGRLIATIEADGVHESMDRLKELKALPHVMMAEMAEYRSGAL